MKSFLLGAVCATILSFITISSHAAPVPGQGTWETTLQPRDFDGDTATIEAYYDTILRITWLADANYAMTSGFDADGLLRWSDAIDWAEDLDVSGVTGWRIPKMGPIDSDSNTFDPSFSNNATTDFGYADSAGWVDTSGKPASELGHLYYVTLGNLGPCLPNGNGLSTSCKPQEGGGLSNTGPFTNLGRFYWTSAMDSINAIWVFEFDLGAQDRALKFSGLLAWLVHDGDVGSEIDTDEDGIVDSADNCIVMLNGPLNPDAGGNSQLDTDGDGYGNICDPDFDNNLTVDFADLAILKSLFFTTNPDADLNGDGTVDFADLAILKSFFFRPPGPSALVP